MNGITFKIDNSILISYPGPQFEITNHLWVGLDQLGGHSLCFGDLIQGHFFGDLLTYVQGHRIIEKAKWHLLVARKCNYPFDGFHKLWIITFRHIQKGAD